MRDTSEVRHWRNVGGFLDLEHQIVGEVAGSAACTIGHTDKCRAILGKILNRLIQGIGRLRTLGGEEFKRERRFARLDDVADMHCCGDLSIITQLNKIKK